MEPRTSPTTKSTTGRLNCCDGFPATGLLDTLKSNEQMASADSNTLNSYLILSTVPNLVDLKLPSIILFPDVAATTAPSWPVVMKSMRLLQVYIVLAMGSVVVSSFAVTLHTSFFPTSVVKTISRLLPADSIDATVMYIHPVDDMVQESSAPAPVVQSTLKILPSEQAAHTRFGVVGDKENETIRVSGSGSTMLSLIDRVRREVAVE